MVTLVFTWLVTIVVCFGFVVYSFFWAGSYGGLPYCRRLVWTLGLCSLGLIVVRAMWLHLLVFTWLVITIVFMDSKSDGRHFFRVCFWLCFLLVLGLCLWWFAVVQAAGLDAWAVLSGSCSGGGKVVITLVFCWLVTIVFLFQK